MLGSLSPSEVKADPDDGRSRVAADRSPDIREDRRRRGRPRPAPATPPPPAAAAGGIEGILAARRAPAFAQGTKLHWVRWVDFVPEAGVELKRQAPEAGQARGRGG